MKKQFDMDNIPSEKFEFAQIEDVIHDEKLKTKPIGYFKDAWLRFKKNRASLVATFIIICVILYALIVPFIANYKLGDKEGIYTKARPKIESLSFLKLFDGGFNQKLNDKYLIYYAGIGMAANDYEGKGVTWESGMDSEYNPIIAFGDVFTEQGKQYRNIRTDSYLKAGFQFLSVTKKELDSLLAWEKETGIKVIYPMIDISSKWMDSYNATDANFWYRHKSSGSPVNEKGKAMELNDVMANGLVDNYLRDENGNVMYSIQKDKSMLQIRVLYYNYYIYINGHEPNHYLGTDGQGFDLFVRLAYGLRTSILLALFVSIINLLIGTIYGAIEGYYGGWVDLTLERISDILIGIPFIVFATLIQLHYVSTGKMSVFAGLLIAFCMTGWISIAYRVRTQFYRFKNQEYVLAARTLGAKDWRLMFKHIFPNAIGTIITQTVLVIPSTIFTESLLSYLGIANFQGKKMTSLGTLLSNGQQYLSTDPHIIMLPALAISLLMISFNLFGNGLRDAFNPSLRGADE
ncbi:ABC transporter permease [Lachnoclostridium sp.]|uniref:ABC transporter permease n=1 Tax=Lachnoclostridium sp. TaxID=2028282 RepID=UPI00289DD13F|nr:ABC transporter permease [Lachnoclostridium sp.]